MNDTSEIHAKMDADFAIECAASPILSNLVQVAGRERVYMAWCLGWATGTKRAYEVAISLCPVEGLKALKGKP